MNEAFDLAPWELAPDSPEQAQGVASGRVKGGWLGKQDQEFWIRTVQTSLNVPVRFARPVGSQEEGNWVFYSPAPIVHSLEAWIERRLFYIAVNADLGRLFYLSFESCGVNGRGLVVLNSQGQGHLRWLWPQRGAGWQNDVLFALDASGLKEAQATRWRQTIQEELANFDSDARFALNWIQLPISEQKHRLTHFERGSLHELQNVWKQVLRCDSTFSSNDDDWIWQWDVLRDIHLLDDGHGEVDFSELPLSLQLWHNAVIKWFGLHEVRFLVKTHSRPLTAIAKSLELSFSIEPFDSHHERLEATLQLRDWARGKVPDELLQTLH